MILFADIETSGLIKRELPMDHVGQPWAVSMAAMLATIDGEEMDAFHTRIRAEEGRKIAPGAEAVHGISSRAAGRSGVSEVVALGMLCGFSAQAKYVIGYGIDFDRKVVESLLMRRQKDTRLWTRPGLEFVDLMLPCTQICKIEPKEPRSDGNWKWPSLDEAIQHILGEAPRAGHHHANEDIGYVRRLYLELRKRNMLEIAA